MAQLGTACHTSMRIPSSVKAKGGTGRPSVQGWGKGKADQEAKGIGAPRIHRKLEASLSYTRLRLKKKVGYLN